MDEINSNIDELIRRLPEGYEQTCKEKKAIERTREIKSPMDLGGGRHLLKDWNLC